MRYFSIIKVKTYSGNYKAIISSSIEKKYIPATHHIIIITNKTLAPLYLSGLKKYLVAEKIDEIIIPDGEKYKNIKVIEEIYTDLLKNNVNRESLILALGGGVIGDIAGFTASTIMRGIQFINFPTSLLSMVDASIGGKTGINHKLGKNLIGTFYQPSLVYINTSFLKTLPEREYISGFSEILKYGFIIKNNIIKLIENNIEKIKKRDPQILYKLIKDSVKLKAYVVKRDEKEKDIRIILNFGHTLAHAIEKITDYKEYLHGEAVAIGIIYALILSKKLIYKSLITDKYIRRIINIFKRIGLPVKPVNNKEWKKFDFYKDIIVSISLDKKNREANNRFVLLKKEGKPIIIKNITNKILKETWVELNEI